MNKIRVLHCIHSLSGGGAETQVKILSSNIGTHDVDVAIFCVNDEGVNDITDQNVKIIRHSGGSKYDFSLFSSLNKVIAEFKPDVVHAWLPASMTIPAMIVSRVRGIPCIFSYRNLMRFHRPLSVPEYIVAKICASKIVSNNSISQSKYLFRQMYHSKNGVVIKNAVDIDSNFLKKNDEYYNGGKLKILFVGRLTKQKNISCLIKALSLLDADVDYKLTVCGDGEDKAQLINDIECLNLSENINLLGFKKNIHQYMKASHLLLLPSLHEGMPNVLLEALEVGLPAIVSDIPAHRDLVGKTGAVRMFDPNSPDELAGRIGEYLSNYDGENLKVKIGKEIASNYSPAHLANEYNTVYRSLVRNNA